MANVNPIGLVLTMDVNGVITGAERAGGAIVQVTNRIDQSTNNITRNYTRITNVVREATQAMANNADSAVYHMQIAYYHLNRLTGQLNRSVMGGFAEAQRASDNFESSMARVEVVMGLTGTRRNNAALREEFGLLREEIIRVGRDTEFTMEEASAAAINLIQSGMRASEVIDILGTTMAFSSASFGTVDIEQATRTAILARSALGADIADMNRVMDMMVVLERETMMSLADMEPFLRSMGSAGLTFENTDPAHLLAIAGAMRQMGRTASQAGNDAQVFARGINYMLRALQMNEDQNIEPGEVMRGGRIRARALANLGVASSDFVQDDGELRPYDEILTRLGGIMQERLNEGMGIADLRVNLQTAVGNQIASNVILLTQRYAELYGRSIGDLAGVVNATNDDSRAAQAVLLSTTEGMKKLLASASNLLLVVLAEPLQWLVDLMIETTRGVINALTEFLQSAPMIRNAIVGIAIAFGLTTLTLAGTTGVILTMLTLMTAFQFSAMALGVQVFTLSGLFAQFYTIALLPMLTTLWPVVFGVVKLIAVLALLYIAYKSNFGGIRDTIQAWGRDIVDITTVIRPLISGEFISGNRWGALSARAQRIAVTLALLSRRAKDFAKGFMVTFSVYLRLLGAALTGVIRIGTWFVNTMVNVAERLGFYAATGDRATQTATAYGAALGVVVGSLLAIRIGLGLFNGVLLVTRGIMAVVSAVTFAWNVILLMNPVALVVIGVIALIAVVTALILYEEPIKQFFGSWWASLNETGGVIDWFVDVVGAKLLNFFIRLEELISPVFYAMKGLAGAFGFDMRLPSELAGDLQSMTAQLSGTLAPLGGQITALPPEIPRPMATSMLFKDPESEPVPSRMSRTPVVFFDNDVPAGEFRNQSTMHFSEDEVPPPYLRAFESKRPEVPRLSKAAQASPGVLGSLVVNVDMSSFNPKLNNLTREETSRFAALFTEMVTTTLEAELRRANLMGAT